MYIMFDETRILYKRSSEQGQTSSEKTQWMLSVLVFPMKVFPRENEM